ncbi:peptidoglycan-binding domain-containing protein [Paractinoplanes globisporus]|uniref:Peptidoglycan-binding domain-containing protein n=1 Tax=Paractinoplanes globisporus TaxID=113565 RepID=A0ABW6WHS9_9ACTN|nr:peptidoglycan-binding domain-containing protein [Actinoplanes globisporus]
MTDDFLDDLVRRLAAGEDPRQLQRSLVAEPWQKTLQRCAVPRTFDDSLYDTLLNPAEGPGLTEVVNAGFAERVAGATDLYRLRGGVRDEWLDTWPAQPEERVPHGVVDLSETLADVYAGFEDRLEELYHRAVAEPERAATLFTDLFSEADRRFDLPGCQDVLDTLSEPARIGWFGDQLAELRADRHAYLRARLFWATEWRQSARYLPRAAADERLLALTGNAGPRAVEISAPGGMGKTMLLRSFIARECVPEPRRIPCARLDFDLVSPAAAAHRPWLLLLEIADQLNRQMLSSPFQEMLNDHGIFRALLDPMPSAAMRAAAGQLASAERIDADVTSRFARVLAETADRPVLIVLDTFEQVLLHPDSDPEKILGAMGRLLEGNESVRLVVAGRYPLSDRIENLPALVPGIERVDIEPFSPDESREYLRRRRRLTDDELIAAMVAKSGGRPFMLALLGDLARDNPGLTAAEVWAYDDPAVLYLVERIVARIDDPAVRWLLRYGVIPRHLSREFVTEVMAPYLRQGMAGRSQVDTPGDDDLPGGVAESLFPTDVLATPEAPLDLDAIWRRLLQYAGESSWVTTFADHPDAVVFHPDLVEPLRRVVRKHRVYNDLHADAARYCADRARADYDNWLMWTLEEIYHRFQGGRADEAEATWRRALGDAYTRGDFPARRRIAEEVLRAEYVDEYGAPRAFDERRTLVTWPLLAHAHFELARAAVALAERRRLGPTDPVLRRGFAELRQVQRIREEHGWPGGPEEDSELARITATAHRLADDRNRSLEVAREALTTATGDERAALEEVVADGIRGREPERAAEIYKGALETTEATPAQRRLWLKLLTLRADNDQLTEALQMFATLPVPLPVTAAGASVLINEGRLWLRAGMPTTLLERAYALNRGDPVIAEARAWCLGAARLALHQPFAALDEVRGALKAADSFRNELSELAARIDGDLLNVSDAFSRVEVLCRDWTDAGEAERSWQAAGLPLEFDLRGAATLANHLDYLLFSAREADRRPGTEGWFRYRVARIRIAARQGAPELGSLIAETRAALGPEPVPRHAVEMGIVMLGAEPEAGLALLLDGLRRTETVAARLAGLIRLRFCPPVPVDADRQAELARLIGPMPERSPEDVLPALLTWAEYQRVFGDPAAAQTAVDEAAALLPPHATPDSAFRTWLVMDAALRLGPGSVATPYVDVSALRLAEVAPVLAAAIRILQLLRRPDLPDAARELRDAGTELANGGGVGSEWEAYLEIARSAVALETGRPDSCAKHLTLATRVWERIHPGVPLPEEAVRRLEVPASEPSPPSPVPTELAAWTPTQVVARLRWKHPAIATRFDRPGRAPVDRLSAMSTLLDAAPDEPLASQLESLVAELLDHPGRLQAGLGRLLGEGVPMERSEGQVDLSIATRSSLLGAMPWELATFGSSSERLARNLHFSSVTRVLDGDLAATHTVALLQRVLRQRGSDLAVDGLFGPDTARALRGFYRSEGLPDELDPDAWRRLHLSAAESATGLPEVLVVRPNPGLEISHARGGRGQGIDVAKLYKQHGFGVRVMHSPGPDEFTTEVRNCALRGRLAVLHVVGGFGIAGNDVYVEFASAQEVTDLGKWTGPRSSGVLASTTFDRPFAALPPHLPRPLVILDPGRPDAHSEAVRQLLLRNAFARHLLELANIPTVLAMGLDPADEYRRAAMIGSLALGETANDLAHQLRHTEPRTSGKELASVVISTHVPPYAMQRWRVR